MTRAARRARSALIVAAVAGLAALVAATSHGAAPAGLGLRAGIGIDPAGGTLASLGSFPTRDPTPFPPGL